jgi:glyoxylase-like metal-dependent hydrolase (beta-lactamase superfamily II)
MEEHKDSFRFKIGSFECLVVSDGMIRTPGVHNPDDLRPAQIDVMCLFIRTGEHSVLIDAGWGVGSEPNAGKLVQNLQAEGIQCGEIDTIILSHGHPDHIGGITDAEGKLVFPNARYIMSKKEWEFWVSDPDLSQLDVPEESVITTLVAALRRNLTPIKDKLDLINGETRIMPGIDIIEAPGHTIGHIVPLISSGTEQLLCICDLVQQPLEFKRPDLYRSYDMVPEQALNARTQILSRFYKPNVLVFACHFSFPGLGHIIQKDGMWFWQPIEVK